jgi:hypothetical protein
MNPDSSSSASNTGTTSTNGHGKPNEKKPGGPSSEAEFLQQQADEARKALSAAFGDLSKSLRDGLDPTLWTKEHPWAMVAGATVAGFAAAAMFVPSKEEQALRRLARIEKALMPERSSKHGHDGHDSGEDGGAKDFSKGRTGFLGAVGRQVLETIKPALMSALTAGITAKAATPDNQAPQPPPADPYAEGAGAPPSDPSAAI